MMARAKAKAAAAAEEKMRNDPALRAKPPTAVAFSGGGTRSYLCSLGYLRGLHDLGLMQNVRYMSGVSGGTWATVAYVYFQKSHPGGPATDAELLGDILAPQDSSLANLAEMPAACARTTPRAPSSPTRRSSGSRRSPTPPDGCSRSAPPGPFRAA